MKELHNEMAKYLSGSMSDREAGEFLRRYLSDEGTGELSKEIERLWNQESEEGERWDPSNLFSRLQQVKEKQRFISSVQVSRKASAQKRSFFTSTPGRIAASVSFILVASGLLWLGSIRTSPQNLVADATEIVKSNPIGQKSTICLADGSKVFLNSGSKITYLSDFGKEKRVIRLDGEAFFEVKKDSKPFIVFTNSLATTALGTSFNIRAYENQKSEIALITGKVSVENIFAKNEKLILNPGESALQNEPAGELMKSTFDPDTKTLWKDGVIYFDKTPLDEAILVLEQWYGVEIIVVDEVPEALYCTGSFKNAYLSNVLASIGFSLDFEYEIIDNKKVKLTFKK